MAGPVAAAAVALPLRDQHMPRRLAGVRDSKDMSAAQRESAAATIKSIAMAWGIGHASAAEIDQLGIIGATKLAMQNALAAALEANDIVPDCLFLDYMLWPERRDLPQVSIVEGDRHSLTIAAASVLAKVWRDNCMRALHKTFPQYGFDRNKGYGTESHVRALLEFGPCAHHRRSFKPIRDLVVKHKGQIQISQ